MAPSSAHRVYIGMINKVNANVLQNIATRFLQRQQVTGYHAVVPYPQGFIVSFSSEKDALDCIQKCEDALLQDAVYEKAMARLVLPTEDEIPTIQKLEKEIWITVNAGKTVTLPECDEQVVALAKFYYEQGLMKKMPTMDNKKLEEYVEGFIDLPNIKARKYSIQLVSSEAVMVAQMLDREQYEEAGFVFKLPVSPIASHASNFKHRFDVHSTLIYLPSDYRAICEESRINQWMEPMREKLRMEVQSLRHKVIDPRIWQLFTRSEREQSDFVERLNEVCGSYVYKDTKVDAMPMFWLMGMVHKWAPSLLPAKITMSFSYNLEAFPEDLQAARMEEQNAIEADPGERWCDDLDISSDAQYDDISRNRDPIEFLVSRDKKRIAVQETIMFYDVFVMTVGDEQQALKRKNTLQNFENELERFVAYGKAIAGVLLNYHLPFDTLGGICLYLVFDDKMAALRMIKDVTDNKIFIKNQIQQHAGAKMTTEVKAGAGFKALFRQGDVTIPQDLKQISEEIVHS